VGSALRRNDYYPSRVAMEPTYGVGPMKILAATFGAALAIAVLSGCTYDRYGNDQDRNSQLNSNKNSDLPAKVFDLIGRGGDPYSR
jgi:hypothetical protein